MITMPDWCQCILHINGSISNMKRVFLVMNPTYYSTFNLYQLYPLKDHEDPFQKWGVKWDVRPDSVRVFDMGPKFMSCAFETPWSYPDKWMKRVSHVYNVDMEIKWVAFFGDQYGVTTVKNGTITNECVYDITDREYKNIQRSGIFSKSWDWQSKVPAWSSSLYYFISENGFKNF